MYWLRCLLILFSLFLGSSSLVFSTTVFADNTIKNDIANETPSLQITDSSRLTNDEMSGQNVYLNQPAQHISNYIAATILCLSFTILVVVYLSPIYKHITSKFFYALPLKIYLLFCLSIVHMMCWVITGLNYFLLYLIFYLSFKSIMLVNRKWDIFLLFNYCVLDKYKTKFPLILLSIYIVLIVLMLIFDSQWQPLWMTLVFLPLIILFFLIFLIIVVVDYKQYYPSTHKTLLTLLDSTNITISLKSNNSNKSKKNAQSDHEDHSNGKFGGGGASGSW